MPPAMSECPVPSGERRCGVALVCVEAYAFNDGRKHVGASHPLRALLQGMR